MFTNNPDLDISSMVYFWENCYVTLLCYTMQLHIKPYVSLFILASSFGYICIPVPPQFSVVSDNAGVLVLTAIFSYCALYIHDVGAVIFMVVIFFPYREMNTYNTTKKLLQRHFVVEEKATIKVLPIPCIKSNWTASWTSSLVLR